MAMLPVTMIPAREVRTTLAMSRPVGSASPRALPIRGNSRETRKPSVDTMRPTQKMVEST